MGFQSATEPCFSLVINLVENQGSTTVIISNAHKGQEFESSGLLVYRGQKFQPNSH